MMGRGKCEQGQFFYEFNLDDVVPPDHLVRKIDAMLDLGWVHEELAPYYSHTGRPSIDPELMIRMLIVGYVFAIRSERMICREVQVNLAYRWYCKLGVEDKIPDHSAFSRARHERFRESDALRRVFERVVAICIAAGLVGGEAFSIDASLIRADVDKQKRAADRLAEGRRGFACGARVSRGTRRCAFRERRRRWNRRRRERRRSRRQTAEGGVADRSASGLGRAQEHGPVLRLRRELSHR
jgi:transposase